MAKLTIPDEVTVATFTVTGSNDAFPFDFAVFDKADLRVQVGDDELAQSDFTLVGELLDGGGYQGGEVLLNDPVEDTVVRIYRSVRPARPENFGAVTAVPVNAIDLALNRQMAVSQDLRRDLDGIGEGSPGGGGGGTSPRAVLVPVGEAGVVLPGVDARKNKILGFNSAGAPVAVTPSEGGGGGGGITSVNGKTGDEITLAPEDLGAGETGKSLFQATSAFAARVALGATTLGQSLMTAANAAAVRTLLGLGAAAVLGVGAGGVAAHNDPRFEAVGGGVSQSAMIAALSDVAAFRAALNMTLIYPEDHGAEGDWIGPGSSATNDGDALFAALSEAASTGFEVYLARDYYCNRDLVLPTGSVTICGPGGIVFGNNRGIEFPSVHGEWTGTKLSVRGVTFRAMNLSSKACILASNPTSVEGSGPATDGRGGTNETLTLEDVTFTGATYDGLTAFNWAVDGFNARNVHISRVRVMGDRNFDSGRVAQAAGGFRFGGGAGPVEFKIEQTEIYFCKKAVCFEGGGIWSDGTGGGPEGIYIDALTVVGCEWGIYDVLSAGGEPLLHVTNSHFNTRTGGIISQGRIQFGFLNCNFYQFGASPTGAYTMIDVNNVSGAALNGRIRDITMYASAVSPPKGIVIGGSAGLDNVQVSGVQLDGSGALTVGIHLKGNANGVRIADDIEYLNCTTKILNEAGGNCTFYHAIKSDGSGTAELRNSGNDIPFSILRCFASFVPNANGARNIGTDLLRWVFYGTQGDFSGNLKAKALVSEDGVSQLVSGTPVPVVNIGGRNLHLGGIAPTSLIDYLITPGTLVRQGGTVQSLGVSGTAYHDCFLVNAPTVSCDGRFKVEVLDWITPELLAAVRSVPTRAYTRTEDEDDGKIHFGPFAQDIVAAFEAVGLDPFATRVVSKDPDGFLMVNMTLWQSLKLAAIEAATVH